jgi:hypothetical protein
LTKRTDFLPSLASQTPTPENQIDGVAGEDIEAGDLCYIGTDGLFYRTNTGSAAATKARGMAATSQREGFPLTIYRVAVFGYTETSGSGSAVPGTDYYVSSTAGRLSDTAPSGSGFRVTPVAFGHAEAGAVQVTC